MNNWQKVRLGDVVLFNPRESIKKGAVVKKIAMDKLSPYTRLITGYEEVPFSSGTKFRNGDTLMARITPCLENGKIAQVSILGKAEIAFGSTEYIVFRNIDDVTDSRYVYYFVTSPWFRDIAIKSMVGSSGRQRVQQDVLENLEINLPPLEEQERIAKILGSLDDKIELNNKINRNLEAQAEALFKQWFVDFNFPDPSGNPYRTSGGAMIDSPMGTIPEGWRVGTISDMIDILSGFAFKSELYKEQGRYKLITIKGVQDGYLELNGAVSIDNLPTRMPSHCLLNIGDILLSLTGNVGRCCLVDRDELLLNQRVAKLRPVRECDSAFTYTMFRGVDMRNKLELMARGTAQANLSPIETSNMVMIIPANNTLDLFAKICNPMYVEFANRNIENIRLAELRDSLLPKLMNNEIKL